jgi:hypothetical protein
LLTLKQLQQENGGVFAVLAVGYGVLAAVFENLYVALAGSEEWSANLLGVYLFLYGWLAAFVWLGLKIPRRRSQLFLSGVIPIGLLALSLLFSWPIHLPAVLLMAVAIYQSRSTFAV